MRKPDYPTAEASRRSAHRRRMSLNGRLFAHISARQADIASRASNPIADHYQPIARFNRFVDHSQQFTHC